MRIHLGTNGYSFYNNFNEVVRALRDNLSDGTQFEMCKHWCKARCIGLKDDFESDKLVVQLLQNIFSIYKVKKNIHCICTNIRDVEYIDSKGILLVITNYLGPTAQGLHDICKIIRGYGTDVVNQDISIYRVY